ncbi:MAG: alkaline phosphatase family protein [Verrucomicrobia bacterium]|nr:alkaline phosphatase family protein [Verrucomicrobiota bacterium]
MPKTLLLGLDGLDWDLLRPLIARGELPAFQHLVTTGVTGNLHTLQPTLSPILWNSIATGQRAAKHGIHGFTEVDEKSGAVRPASSLSRRCKAVWHILQQNGARCHVLNWFASHPAEPLNGSCVSDLFPEGAPPLDKPWPLRPGLVHPARLGPALAELRMGPDELDGDLLKLFVPRGAEVDQAKDKRLFVLARELAKAFSVHNAATHLLHTEPWDFLAAYWRTPDLLFHYFMPFHGPAIEGVDPKLAELYGEVVNSTCRLFDRMLGTYLHLAGPDANVIVVSDHGFQSGARRPPFNENPFANPEAWHRPQGVFLARSPLLKSGEQIHGARLLDITPTILTLHGLAPARDMDGRVLAEAFRDEPKLDYIDSWEKIPGDTGQHPPGAEFDAADAAQLIQQFVDLGYIDPLDHDKAKAAAQTREGNAWNLARDHLDAGQPFLALPLLEDLYHAHPENPAYTQLLAQTQKQVGLAPEAERTLAALFERLQPGPTLTFLRAELALERRDYAEGLRLLRELEKQDPRHAALHLQLARTYVGLQRLADARREFETVIKGDAENAVARQGIAQLYLRERHWELAAAAALKATELQHNLPYAHYFLGLAIERLGHREVALDAFRTALNYAPGLIVARRALIALLLKTPGHETEVAQHRQLIAIQLDRRQQAAALIAQIRAQAQARAASRTPVVAAAESSAGVPPASVPEIENRESKIENSLSFILVSGLPRSGTSLMMQLLQAGGISLQTDGQRAADIDNPEGYLEWEAIKTLPKNPRVLDEADGRAIKVISLLLPALPRRHKYKVIFMQRPVEEVAASQLKMLQRRFPAKTHAAPEKMAATLRQHRDETLALLRAQKNIEVLEVSYPDLVRAPADWLPRLAAFLAPRWPLATENLPAIIKPALHRQRTS